MEKKDFNEFRFNGLEYTSKSNKYLTMNRVSSDEEKIVVKVASYQLLKTKFGYALILDDKHVVFVKSWQVSENYFGVEVLLSKEYFNVKEWGDFPDFAENDENLLWETWLETAKAQDSYTNEDGVKLNPVKWEK